MALYLVATPIGNENDLSFRALETLKKVEKVILEERKEGSAFLRRHGLQGKTYFQLNEHTDADSLKELVKICQAEDVALITDCGTPGFSDPGPELVKACRQQNITVKSLPGASSLMTLLSLSSQKITQFVFRGFLSPETEQRQKELREIQREKRALILMDTPYRQQKMIGELTEFFADRKILFTANLTAENEIVIEALGRDLATKLSKAGLEKKAEFILLIYPA